MTTNEITLSERIFRLLVRFFFGALLAITLYLSLVVVVILLFDKEGLGLDWVPIIFSIDLVFITACCLFAAWQWQRLPKKLWMVAGYTISAVLIYIGLNWSINGHL